MRKSNRSVIIIICLVACICVALYISLSNSAQQASANNKDLIVTVIDAGQGDSILVKSGDDTLLIDASGRSDSTAVLLELKQQSVEDIDFLIATHPHEDHIGGMVPVIENYQIGAVYMADTESESKTYKQLVEAIESNGISIIEAYAGLEFKLGDAVCTIISPARDADHDANNESIAVFIDYFDSEFLFTGDMEKKAEKDLILNGYLFDADVLKVAHHGSMTGTSEEFLKIASPQYAVISCGEGNSYGHPHEETLELLREYGVITYRTDISGDITFISDGRSIEVMLETPASE